jgi:hypothetical protein
MTAADATGTAEPGGAAPQRDTRVLHGSRFQLDVAGHHARPDVFELTVHREARPWLRFAAVAPE